MKPVQEMIDLIKTIGGDKENLDKIVREFVRKLTFMNSKFDTENLKNDPVFYFIRYDGEVKGIYRSSLFQIN